MRWTELLNEERPSEKRFEENEELGLSALERDYYTIVGSSYFRRLQKKTQVYTLDESDFIRTRLTHSIEVSSIAEMLGKRIGMRIEERLGQCMEEKNSESPERGLKECPKEELPENFREKLSMVLRCAGLLHDIGNPPFGHSGEEYIRDFFENNESVLKGKLIDQMWYDLVNYEGNAHNIRIVTKSGTSSNPEDRGHGMDLTNAVINSIIKYPCNSMVYEERTPEENGKRKRGKIGYYFSEEWIVKKVMKKTGTMIQVNEEDQFLKNPIMLIMEAADDIAYATADVEDAIKKGKISIAEFTGVLPEEDIEGINESERGIQKVQVVLKRIREQSMIDVVECFMENYEQIMEGEFDEELIDRPGQRYNLRQLKDLMKGIYRDRDEFAEYKHNSKKQIMDILQLLTDIVRKKENNLNFKEYLIRNEMKQYLDKAKREIKTDYKVRYWLAGKEAFTLYYNYLAVVDFVSGMTDSYVGVFSDNWHDDRYIFEKKEQYKQQCLRELSEKKSDIGAVLESISHVDCWTNMERSIILNVLVNHEQINSTYQLTERDKEILRLITDQYDAEGATVLSGTQWEQVMEMLDDGTAEE
ncbi:MAG: dNTP triphosphohydrolase [Lachnospiraceae bacterium]|nr:dNTP triphosphohydrolase [Lachnospiraceae bacterium]